MPKPPCERIVDDATSYLVMPGDHGGRFLDSRRPPHPPNQHLDDGNHEVSTRTRPGTKPREPSTDLPRRRVASWPAYTHSAARPLARHHSAKAARDASTRRPRDSSFLAATSSSEVICSRRSCAPRRRARIFLLWARRRAVVGRGEVEERASMWRI